MTGKALKPVEELTPDQFRKQLAGLCSTEQQATPEDCQDLAVRTAVMLAKHYNRDTLDTLALWSRIETALKTGVEKGASGAKMLSAMLDHVKALPRGVASDPEARALMEEFAGRDEQWLEDFAEYVRTTIYSVLVFARVEWQDRKKSQYGRDTVEDEAAARESGEWHSTFFPEEEVQEALERRAEKRGEEVPGGLTTAESLLGDDNE